MLRQLSIGVMVLGVAFTTLADEGTKTNTQVPSYINNSQYKFGVGIDQGLSVIGQFNNNINLALGSDGVAADYIFLTGQFNPTLPFTWYASIGGWYEWDKTCHECIRWDNNSGRYYRRSGDYFRDFGVRAPFGLDWNFASRWDAYIQLSPALNVADDFDLEFTGALGARYAF